MTRPTLNVLLQQAQDAAVDQSEASQNRIAPGKSPALTRPRSYASPMDVDDTHLGYDSPLMHVAPGTRRTMWSIPPLAVTHVPINTLKTSATPATTQASQIQGAGTKSGVVASNVWAPLPNLELSLTVNGPVNMSATLPVQSTSPADSVQFAFYRRGQPLSQIFSHTTHANVNTPTITTLAFTDPSPLTHSPLNSETYQVWWKGASGNVSSPGVGRSFFVTSLIPQ
jgi:hypothetical protein